jgi:hypothetical protein
VTTSACAIRVTRLSLAAAPFLVSSSAFAHEIRSGQSGRGNEQRKHHQHAKYCPPGANRDLVVLFSYLALLIVSTWPPNRPKRAQMEWWSPPIFLNISRANAKYLVPRLPIQSFAPWLRHDESRQERMQQRDRRPGSSRRECQVMPT